MTPERAVYPERPSKDSTRGHPERPAKGSGAESLSNDPKIVVIFFPGGGAAKESLTNAAFARALLPRLRQRSQLWKNGCVRLPCRRLVNRPGHRSCIPRGKCA